MVEAHAAKRELRRMLRARRSKLVAASSPESLADRSRRIVEHLVQLPEVRRARCVVAYESLPGEVDTTSLFEWVRSRDLRLVVVRPSPDAATPPPATADVVVVVPALGLTDGGERLGQGGGWYDRYLADRHADSIAVGLVFAEFLLDDVPQDDHDQLVDCVVSDDGASWRP